MGSRKTASGGELYASSQKESLKADQEHENNN
jgi:hypothetical protein